MIAESIWSRQMMRNRAPAAKSSYAGAERRGMEPASREPANPSPPVNTRSGRRVQANKRAMEKAGKFMMPFGAGKTQSPEYQGFKYDFEAWDRPGGGR